MYDQLPLTDACNDLITDSIFMRALSIVLSKSSLSMSHSHPPPKLATFAVLVGCAILLAHPGHAGITTDPAAANGKTFDYIVVGGGTAGTTVAARLAENPTFNILMIEVGGDNRTNPGVFNVTNEFNTLGGPLDWTWPADQGKVIHG